MRRLTPPRMRIARDVIYAALVLVAVAAVGASCGAGLALGLSLAR